MIEFPESDIGIPAQLGPFYLPESNDVVYVAQEILDGLPVAMICLDEDGEFQIFPRGGGAAGAEPRLTHYSHVAAANRHLDSIPRLPLNHWAEWVAGKSHWRVTPD